MMITGDNERTARAVAEQVGIDPENVHAEVLPEDKSDAVEAIQDEGRKAMMVGDGVNDAPALAVAYVGTAIGSGTDVAIEAADVTLMRDDPLDVVKAIRISDATLQKIKQNLVWALGYNTAMIPLASLGLLQPVLPPARWPSRVCRCCRTVYCSVGTPGSRLRAPRPPPVNYPPYSLTADAVRSLRGVVRTLRVLTANPEVSLTSGDGASCFDDALCRHNGVRRGAQSPLALIRSEPLLYF